MKAYETDGGETIVEMEGIRGSRVSWGQKRYHVTDDSGIKFSIPKEVIGQILIVLKTDYESARGKLELDYLIEHLREDRCKVLAKK